jgi:lipopolysaccharide/colanic/teichoic acid biosynthesis glycosyltransferase
MLKRIFDIFFSLFGLIILSPVFIIISIVILCDSKGGIFYSQERIGKDEKKFFLLKFRTMRPGSDKKGLLTIGGRDNRITGSGYFLRKYKLDELPQLINVLMGDMSFVGPRPEVQKYVSLYNDDQRKVFTVKPGITDFASIEYSDENTILGNVSNPEEVYINTIMPEKLNLNLKYIREKNMFVDIKIILKTLFKVFR